MDVRLVHTTKSCQREKFLLAKPHNLQGFTNCVISYPVLSRFTSTYSTMKQDKHARHILLLPSLVKTQDRICPLSSQIRLEIAWQDLRRP